MKMNQAQWIMKTKVGTLYLVASEKGLKGIFWDRQKAPLARALSSPAPEIKILAKAVRQLEEYLGGKRRVFALKLDPDGTAFQRRVWSELAKIPYGRTCSYADVARRIKNAKAVRAVGAANGKNPVCIVVPCHRVIAADGSIGGYSGGLRRKRKLLSLETA